MMIKNERQYKISKSEAEKFQRALDILSSKDNGSRTKANHKLIKIQKEALKSKLDELLEEIREYEALVSGKRKIIELSSLEDLPKALIQARISKGLTQKKLADLLGMKEQLLQRYEATDFSHVSFSRLMEISKALGLKVRKEVFLPSSELTLDKFFKRLGRIGLKKEFVLNRFLSPSLRRKIGKNINALADKIIFEVTKSISQIYGWTPSAIIGSDELLIDKDFIETVRFKLRTGAEEKRLNVYTVYAYYLALHLLQGTQELPIKAISRDPKKIRKEILKNFREITFKNVLYYVWSLGIPVLPLNDPGAFYGACWRIDGRNVIVLKQMTNSIDRWLNDLLHELYHAGEDPNLMNFEIIESSEMSQERIQSEEEQEATNFAGEVVLGGRAEELVNMCVEATQKKGKIGSVELLKSVVPKLAKKENVSVGALANYMAFRLSLQNINWWGAATNLQATDHNPFEIARNVLLEKTDFSRIPEPGKSLISQALMDIGGEVNAD